LICPEVSSFYKLLGCLILGAMAGYSVTPLPKKLGIEEGSSVLLRLAPAGFEQLLCPLPGAAKVTRAGRERAPFDVIVFSAEKRAVLVRELPRMVAQLKPDGGLWIGWPKKSSGRSTDLEENFVRIVGLEAGLVDNKISAIDETWSGLRFVYRLRDRAE